MVYKKINALGVKGIVTNGATVLDMFKGMQVTWHIKGLLNTYKR